MNSMFGTRWRRLLHLFSINHVLSNIYQQSPDLTQVLLACYEHVQLAGVTNTVPRGSWSCLCDNASKKSLANDPNKQIPSFLSKENGIVFWWLTSVFGYVACMYWTRMFNEVILISKNNMNGLIVMRLSFSSKNEGPLKNIEQSTRWHQRFFITGL